MARKRVLTDPRDYDLSINALQLSLQGELRFHTPLPFPYHHLEPLRLRNSNYAPKMTEVVLHPIWSIAQVWRTYQLPSSAAAGSHTRSHHIATSDDPILLRYLLTLTEYLTKESLRTLKKECETAKEASRVLKDENKAMKQKLLACMQLATAWYHALRSRTLWQYQRDMVRP